MNLGHQIAILRNNLKISQKELGEKLNVAGSTVAQWETNVRTPKIEKFVELADFFSVSADLLLQGDRKIAPEDFKNYEELVLRTEKTIQTPNPTEEEKQADLIRETFLKLSESDRYILIGEAMKLLKQSESQNIPTQELKRA